LPKTPTQLFRGLSKQARADDKAVLETRQMLMELWAGDSWQWLTGEDVDGRPIIWTRDERSDDLPLKPFPRDKPYLKKLVEDAWRPEPLFIDKARQMYVSTTLMLLLDHYCRFINARNVLVSKQKEGEAEVLIREKLRGPNSQLPQWVQDALPISRTPANMVTYKNTQSTLRGVAQNFAISEARGTTASIVMVDEAAYQDFLPDILTAVSAMASRLWVLTTARVAGRGAKVFKQYIEEV
jgi:hypothetical protein